MRQNLSAPAHDPPGAPDGTLVGGLLKAVLAALGALLQLPEAFIRLLVFAVVLDLVTTAWDRGEWVGLVGLPRRVYTEWGRRLGQNVVGGLVLVSLANVFPALFGYLVEVSVIWATVSHGSGSVDHVFPAGHSFRRRWARVVGAVDRMWEMLPGGAADPGGPPPAAPPRDSPPGEGTP